MWLTTWQTVQLGQYPSTQAIRAALTAKNVKLSSWPEELIDGVPLATKSQTVRLALVRPSQLFPGRNVRLTTIFKEVTTRLGGSLCSPEVGLILHLQVDTDYHTLYAVAMEPLVVADKSQVLFSVENGIGSSYRMLRGLDGNRNRVWNQHGDLCLDYFVVQIKDDA